MQEILFLEIRKSFVLKLFESHFNIGSVVLIGFFFDSKNFREMEECLRMCNNVKSSFYFYIYLHSTI